MQVLVSVDDLIDTDFESYRPLQKLKSEFQDKDDLLIFVRHREGTSLNVKHRCALEQWVHETLGENKSIVQTFGNWSIRKADWKNERLWFPKVIKDPCHYQVNTEALSKSPWGPLLVPLNRPEDWSALVSTKHLQTNVGLGRFDPTTFSKIQSSLQEEILSRFPELEVIYSGMGTYEHWVYEGLQNFNVINLIVIGLVIFLFRFGMGSSWAGVLFIILTLLTATVTYGIMGYLGFPVDILSNNLFLMLTIATLEDFIILAWISKGRFDAQSTRRLAFPCFLTSLTTAIGFLSLSVSDLGIIRRFGFMAGMGALIEWALLFTAIPAMIQLFPRLHITWDQKKLGPLAQLTLKLKNLKMKKGIALGLLFFVPLSLLLSQFLRIEDSPSRTFPESHPFSKAYAFLENSRNIQSSGSVLFDPETPDEKIRETAIYLKRNPNISIVESPLTVMDWVLEEVPPEIKRGLESDVRESEFMRRYFSRRGTARVIFYTKTSKIE
ncbi:MAG: hypothetical protein K2X47_17155, partial [Bdellovibrionales bacterium]|nr:hypothetical protein [Bdellovibrionales bacterium]